MRDKVLYVEDILESIDAIFDYVKGYELEDLKEDRKTYQAIFKEFEIIGEAMKHIIDEVKKYAPEIDYKGVIAFRNMLVHEYFGIRFETMWDIIFYELPKLKKSMEKVYKEL